MTQFTLSSVDENHLTKSHKKASQILSGNKTNLTLSSKSFYGDSFRSHHYMLCDSAVRKTSESSEEQRRVKQQHALQRTKPLSSILLNKKPQESSKLDVCYRNIASTQPKSLSMPALADKKSHVTRTSMTSPLKKRCRLSSPRLFPLQDCRAKRTLTYSQSDDESSNSQEFSADDDANKENCSLDINKILQSLDQEMRSDVAEKPLEDPASRLCSGSEEEEERENEGKTNQLQSKEMEPAGRQLSQEIGFPNPAGTNRCWMNATLQVLLAMEPFVQQLERSTWRDERTGQSSLVRSFFEVVKYRRRRHQLYLHSALRRFYRSLNALDPIFTTDRQQDATELLVRLLDMFREQFISSERSVKDNCTLRELQLENRPTANRREHNPVCENVEFSLKEMYTCTSCMECTSKCQDHLALYLDVPPMSQYRPSLQEALSRYMQPDVRELKCGKCSGQHSEVETAFAKLPRFLLVQMKRYAVQTAIAEKLTRSLRIPIALSVQKFVTDDVVLPTPWLPDVRGKDDSMQEDEEDRELQDVLQQSREDDQEALELEQAIKLSLQEQRLEDMSVSFNDGTLLGELEEEEVRLECSYRLVSVIMHKGLSPHCGHYVADVYNLEQQQWYHYDDEVVSQPTEEEVVGSARQRNGYVFCYMHRQLFDELTQQWS